MRPKDVHALWVVYVGLLLVLFPHTAWAFEQHEPGTSLGKVTAWAAAFAFECAIAVFTHRLARHVERTPRYRSGRVALRKLRHRVVNIYALALLWSTVISSVANWSHSVEFARELRVFSQYRIPPNVYSVVFGAALPLCSVMFAAVLSATNITESRPNEADDSAKEVQAELKKVRKQLAETERRANETEQQFGAVQSLFGDNGADRIRAARELWPGVSQKSLADVTDTSASYVSEVLRNDDDARADRAT